MSIAELGALGEFIGAIAVIVTLGYLAIQIRLTAKSARSTAIAQAASDHQANLRCLVQDQTLAEAFAKSQRGEEIAESEELQLRWWSACVLRGVETHVDMSDLGVVPGFDERWYKLLDGMATSPIFRRTMDRYVGSTAFRKWLDQVSSSSTAPSS